MTKTEEKDVAIWATISKNCASNSNKEAERTPKVGRDTICMFGSRGEAVWE